MRTGGYQLTKVPAKYGRDNGDPGAEGPLAEAITAAGAVRSTRLSEKAAQTSRRDARARVLEQFDEGRIKFDARSQPRDAAGKFRKVLARLKMNLGEAASEQLAAELERATAAGAIGDYALAKESGANIVQLVEDVKDGDLAKGTVDNIRKGSAELGKLLAYLPMPQGDSAAKVRFSDLPAPASDLIKDLIGRVEDRLGEEDEAKYLEILRSFLAGGRTMSADDMSVELARIMRVLA